MYNLPSIVNDENSPIFLSINIQSLNSKHSELRNQIIELTSKNLKIDVIAIQETWDICQPDLLAIPGYQTFICKNRVNMRGGGVGFYVKNGINFKIIDNLSPFEQKIFESLTIQISYNDKSILLTSAYRSNGALPNMTSIQQLEVFQAMFGELLHNLNNRRLPSYVFIDSNIDLLNLHSEQSKNYLNTILSNGFLQLTMKCTRIQNQSRTLIDQILTSSKCNSFQTGTVISDISDHFFTFIRTPPATAKSREKITYFRNFSPQNLENFKAALNGTDWSPVTNINNVDDSYNSFWKMYMELYELFFPQKKVRFNRNIHKASPFMTAGLLISRKTKNDLFKIQLSNPDLVNVTKYRTYKQNYFKIVRAAKKLYFKAKLEANTKNPKKTWETLNEALGKNKSNQNVSKINVNGTLSSEPKIIANHFNSFFTKIGKDISNSIQPVQKQPEDYIQYDHVFPNLNLTNTTPEHVKKVINSLAPKSSCDVQGVSTKMVKFVGSAIALPLSHIFNLSLNSGKFPTPLKQCRVIPIFKSGDSEECDNYRPISLLSSISKVLEKIVAEKLTHHLIENDLLYLHQYGFLPNRSTEQNLIQIVNYISNAINSNMYCVGIFLDLKKAFDVCSHEILLKKLIKMGVVGKAHEWFKSYLEGRSQCVDIGGTLSDFMELAISVIQGSTLGPLLFLCYINDFWKCTSMFSALFADDTTSLAKGPVLADVISYVNRELQKMANWFRSNKMCLNASKTKYIIFRTPNKPVDPAVCHVVYNCNEIGQPDDPALISPIERISRIQLQAPWRPH
jgi:signal recognition particle subunit SEC65